MELENLQEEYITNLLKEATEGRRVAEFYKDLWARLSQNLRQTLYKEWQNNPEKWAEIYYTLRVLDLFDKVITGTMQGGAWASKLLEEETKGGKRYGEQRANKL